jgi:hypothetical protein
MRIFIVAISIIFASISTASAQARFDLDHGHAADAAKAARDARVAAEAKAAAIARGGPLLPSQSTNFSVGGGGTFKAAPRRTPEEEKADDEARLAWTTRCRPVTVVDREGLSRTKYAEPDCDLSTFNTAGTD